MLQKELNTLRIKFYNDVEKLGFENPVTNIAEGTGYAKGNISSILNKKLQPSEQFLSKFYESFKDILHKSEATEPQPTLTTQNDTLMSTEQQDWKQAHNNLMDAHKMYANSHQTLSNALMAMTELLKEVRDVKTNLNRAVEESHANQEMISLNQNVMFEALDGIRGQPAGTLAQNANNARIERMQKTSNMDTVGS